MSEALSVFFTGIVGVFAGMALLYVTVKLNAFVAGRIDGRRASGGKAGSAGSAGSPGSAGSAGSAGSEPSGGSKGVRP